MPRDPLEEWVILQYDPGGKLRAIRQNTDTVWKLKAQYHSNEKRITLQFNPGGANDARLREGLKSVWLTTTYIRVSCSTHVKCNELTWKRAVVLVSPPLNISKSYSAIISTTLWAFNNEKMTVLSYNMVQK